MKKRSIALATVVAVGLAAAAVALNPQPLPPKCAAAKILAAATKAAAELKCYAQASLDRSTHAPDACLTAAEQAFSKAFAKAEAKGGCLTQGDASNVETTVDLCVGAIVALLPAGTPVATPTPGGCGITNSFCGGSCPTAGEVCSYVESSNHQSLFCICHPPFTATPTPVANFEIWSGQDTVYVINDNEGRQFDFEMHTWPKFETMGFTV